MGEANINPRLLRARYAVRGLLPQRAAAIQAELESGDHSYPFDKVVYANIGNPQQVGQLPVTFFRQVLALLEWEHLLEPAQRETVRGLFPEDAIERALAYQAAGCKLGAYTDSKGFPVVRNEVAEFIKARDGHAADPNRIFLTAGASEGISTILGMIVHTEADEYKTREQPVGVMIPMPQYPLYSATIALCGGSEVPYFLDEDRDWEMDIDELQRSLDQARAGGADVRVLCVINPGNPTGQCLSKESVDEVVRFCERECLVLLADEVYQANTYQLPERPFHSFRKAVLDMGSKVELASFHSVSKGMLGECGRRGGYMELINFGQFFLQQLEKRSSMNLCSNTSGQLMVGMLCNPPQEGDASYPLYHEEMSNQYSALKSRATKLAQAFNSAPGMSVSKPAGSMYLYVEVKLGKEAVSAARKAGLPAETLYCIKLLEKTGIVSGNEPVRHPGARRRLVPWGPAGRAGCLRPMPATVAHLPARLQCVIPGGGFGKTKDGSRSYFRTTFLPVNAEEVAAAIVKFQEEWVAEFGCE